ncbi:MAG: leucine-rich repeat domain-containing protein [Tannerellaceae bacterium]|jgi:hypothetical protein|nr:leucine-rich repeat domain-containing protein [Tannerellaceae bacterium]
MRTKTYLFLSLFLSFFWLCPTGAQAEGETPSLEAGSTIVGGDGLKYLIGQAGNNLVATVVGYKADKVSESITIGGTIPDYTNVKVTGIGVGAFAGYSGLTSVTFGANLDSIGAGAFEGCPNLKKATFGNKATALKSIGVGAFAGSGLTELVFGTTFTSLENIGTEAFKGCVKLEAVTYSGNSNNAVALKAIGAKAFAGCTGLTALSLGSSSNTAALTTIGAGAFAGCTGLTTVNINKARNLASIGDDAFKGCVALETVTLTSVDNLKSIGAGAFQGTKMGKGEITFSTTPSLESIGDSAFAGVTGEPKADFSAFTSLKTIGIGAFAGSKKVTAVKLPVSLVSIGEGAFAGCVGLTTAEIGQTSTTTAVALKTVGADAFNGCTALNTVEIYCADNLKSIGARAFKGTKMGSLVVTFTDYSSGPSTNSQLESIGDSAVAGVTELKKADLAWFGNLKSIGVGAFAGSAKLEQVYLPESLESIGEGAFADAALLTEVKFLKWSGSGSGSGTVECDAKYLETIGADAFKGAGLTTVKLGNATKLTSIGVGAFAGCSELTKVTLSKATKLTSIGAGAFKGTKLSALPFGGASSLTSIGDSAFVGTKLSKVELIEAKAGTVSLKSIGAGAFAGISALQTVSFPASLESIGIGAFAGNGKLKTVTVDDGEAKNLVSIGADAFKGDAELTAVTLGKTTKLTSIGAGAFKGTKLSVLPFGGASSLVSIGDSAFAGTLLTKVDIEAATKPASLSTSVFKSIGVGAFAEIATLTAVKFPASIKSIGVGAFAEDTKLKSVTLLSTTPPSLGAAAFTGTALTQPVIPEGEQVLAAYKASDWWPYFGNPSYDPLAISFSTSSLTGTVTGFSASASSKDKKYLAIPNEVVYEGKVYKITAVGDRAFKNVKALLEVSLPAYLKSIGVEAFNGAVNLTDVLLLPSTPPSLGLRAFSVDTTTCNFWTEDSAAYQAVEAWQPYFGAPAPAPVPEPTPEYYPFEITFTESEAGDLTGTVKGFSVSAVARDKEYVVVPEEVVYEGEVRTITSIGEGAFKDAEDLLSVSLPSGLLSIGDEAFKGAVNLVSVDLLSDTPPSLGVDAFSVDTTTCTFWSVDSAAYQAVEAWQPYFGAPAPGPLSYVVAFRPEGLPVTQMVFIEGERIPTVRIPVIEYAGYTLFWYTGEDTTNIFDFSTPVTSDLDLYPVWVKGIRVTFHEEVGYLDYTTAQVAVAEDSVIPENVIPSPECEEGYMVVWYTGEDEEEIFDFSTPVTSPLDLYPLVVEVPDGIVAPVSAAEVAASLYNLRGELLVRKVVNVQAASSGLRNVLGVSSGIYILVTPDGAKKIKL